MKKLIFILSILFMCSCSHSDTCSHYNCKKPKREYREEICPKCDGTGTVPQTTGQKVGFALCSFGMTLMCDDEQKCPKCHGSGIIKVPVVSDSIIVEY